MRWLNSSTNYGFISLFLHWSMAIILTGLFVLGLYMVGLDYYDTWYHTGPWWHEGFGLLVLCLLIVRVIWLAMNPRVEHLHNHKKWERLLSTTTRISFYLLIFIIAMTGYFISTAKGEIVEFFYWFEVPALLQNIPEQIVDLIGKAHLWLAWIMTALVVLHIVGALKHHFIDKDETLRRIFISKTK